MQVILDRSQQGESELRLKLRFDPETLRLEHTLIGVVVHLDDCPTAGPPGAPALPVRMARIALPRGMRVAELVAERHATTRLTDAPVPLAPLQPTRPGATPNFAYCRPDEGRWKGWPRCRPPEDDGQLRAEPLPAPPYVAPDPERYAAAARAPAVQLIGTDARGSTPIATVAVRPVAMAGEGHLEFSEEIDLTLRLEADEERREDVPSHIVSRAQAFRDVALTRRTVINPDAVFDYTTQYPIELFPKAEYLIVTDNNFWNAETQAAAGAAGDIVASFKRLAKWKRQRGLQAKVVTVTDIVGGRYGDFRSGSRDLQETIRNFLKMAQAEWGVAWVLIGGDTAIVPIRLAAGGREGGINRQDVDPPPENRSVWAGDHLRMNVVSPGTWWEVSTTNKLVRTADGRLIPYDSAGISSSTVAGWYFTTGETYAERSAMATQFVRVNGPASLVNADLQFLYRWNTIPTDLYYSSLVGPEYNQSGKHDWDLLDNGVYGQSVEHSELDGIEYTPTVSLGRAPVNNATEADAFVNKVIAYEKFARPDGTPLASDWPGRAVLVSDNWDLGGRSWISGSTTNPPEPGRYHQVDPDHSIVQLSSMPDWEWSLLCFVSEEEVRFMPRRTDAGPGRRGWYFATSATDLTPSGGGDIVSIPQPSSWLVVYGPAEELAPLAYVFNSTQLDGSLADQEKLRAQLGAETGLYSPRRLYEDVQDMTPAQLAAGPVEVLSSEGLRKALDAGPHIVSLSGHGNWDGCCRLNRAMASTLANGYHTFLAYADSCLTNRLDASSMGEALLTNANGGAVAYIGNTRFSWIGVGDDFQRRFFSQWATLGGTAHLGLLADTRAAPFGNFWWADRSWMVLSLNLLGCPEMPIWWQEPLILRIPETYYYLDDRIRLWWDEPPDPPYRTDLPYRDEWSVTRVHVRQGDREQNLAVRGSSIDARLEGFRPGPATVTISRAGHKPAVLEVRLRQRFYGWLLLVVLVLAAAFAAIWIVTR